MTNEQKAAIPALRKKGMSLSEIASELEVSVNSVKAYCRRELKQKNMCKHCGKPLVQLPGRKPKSYCNDSCRFAWWKNNRSLLKHRMVYHYTCAHCGRAFDRPVKDRKFCKHRCYISYRFYSAI